MNRLALRNRQRAHPINLPLFRQVASRLLDDLFPGSSGELAVHLVTPAAITQINGQFLGHAGATDVITFNYHTQANGLGEAEIFICVEVAVEQARRFHTSCGEELARYFVHGLLHLLGFDDQTPERRRLMKKEENRRLRQIAALFPLRQLERKSKMKL